MRGLRSRWTGVVAGASLAALLAAAGLPAPAAVPCQADVRATEGSERDFGDFKEKSFRVEISSSASCGKVYVDLIATERLFNGELIKTTNRDFRKVSGGASTTYDFRYKIAPDSTLLDWKFEVDRCIVCGTE